MHKQQNTGNSQYVRNSAAYTRKIEQAIFLVLLVAKGSKNFY
jgi:hypothetical protein